MHIRQGDYINSNFGLLSPAYYRKTVIGEEKDIIIFTDQPNLSQEYLNALNPRFVITPNELSGDETFALMSRSKRLILANSTFSWWVGFLALQNSGTVSIPSPWIKSGQYEANLEYPGMLPSKAEFI